MAMVYSLHSIDKAQYKIRLVTLPGVARRQNVLQKEPFSVVRKQFLIRELILTDRFEIFNR